jgi:hypothetical protein
MLRGEKPEDATRTWVGAAGEVLAAPIRGGVKAVNELGGSLIRTFVFDPKDFAAGVDKYQDVFGPIKDAEGNPVPREHVNDVLSGIQEGFDYGRTLPEMPEAKSVGGNIAAGIAQFIVGMKGIDKAWRAANVSLDAMSTLTQTTRAARQSEAMFTPFLVKGAMTDATAFDGHTDNLANLVQSFPALQNPVTEYLASDPNDSQTLGRLKNAIANQIGVAAAEPVLSAIRYSATWLREYRKEQAAVNATQTQAQTDVAKLAQLSAQEKQFAILGDATKDGWTFYDRDAVKAAEEAKNLKSNQIQPAPGTAPLDNGNPLNSKFSQDHAGEGTTTPQLTTPVEMDPEIGRARPNFLANGKRYGIQFDTPEDKLAWLAETGHKLGDKAQEQLKAAGWTPEQVTRIGDAISAQLSDAAGAAAPGDKTLKVGPTARGIYADDIQANLGGPPLDISAKAMQKVQYGEGDSGYGVINFAALKDQQGILSAIRQMQDTFDKRPETRTWAEVTNKAEGVDAFDEILNAPRDRPPGDTEMIAAKQLLAASYAKVYKLSDMVLTASSQGTLDNTMRFAFAQMLETHRLISNYWNWSGTEAARSLAIRRSNIALDTGQTINPRLKDIDRALGTIDGVNNLEFIAGAVKSAIDNGGEAGKLALNKVLNTQGYLATTNRILREIWINGILSSTKSLVVNVLNPAVLAVNQAVERGMMESIARVTGDDTGVVSGQTGQWLYGMGQAVPDALRNARQAFTFGGRGRAWGDMYARTSTDQAALPSRPNALSAAYLGIKDSTPFTTSMARAVDMLGAVVNAPVRANLAGDEFWSTLFYRGELRAQAFRQATNEVSSGKVRPEDLSSRMQTLIDTYNGTQEAPLGKLATEDAHYNTLTKGPGGIGKVLEGISNLGTKTTGPLGWLFVPFHTIPANVLDYSMSRTPLNLLTQRSRSAIMAGGVEGQKELAKTMAGSMVIGLGIDMYQRGVLTGRGSVDPNEARALSREGIKPYSVRLGDTWYNINRLDNFGYMLGMIGDIGDYYSFLHDQDEDVYKGLTMAVYQMGLAMTNSVMSKSYFQGVMNLDRAQQDPKTWAKSYVYSMLSSFVPYSGAANTVSMLNDDLMREAGSSLEAWGSKIPGLNPTAPRIDMFGREMTVSRGTSQTWNALMPLEMSAHNPEPIDAELVRNKMYFKMPSKKFAVGPDEVDMSMRPDVYARFNQLAGNEIQDPYMRMGCKDLLNSIVEGSSPLSASYNMASSEGGNDSEKATMLKNLIGGYRKLAQQQIIQEYPELVHQTPKAKIYGVPVQ